MTVVPWWNISTLGHKIFDDSMKDCTFVRQVPSSVITDTIDALAQLSKVLDGTRNIVTKKSNYYSAFSLSINFDIEIAFPCNICQGIVIGSVIIATCINLTAIVIEKSKW